jgi:hypothetical protein
MREARWRLTQKSSAVRQSFGGGSWAEEFYGPEKTLLSRSRYYEKMPH